MSAVAPAPPSAATSGRPAGFRPDVEGLRAIAVLSVMAYHAGLPLITGGYAGVDVFFVLSGFLITGQLLKEVGSTGTVDLPAFYGRRAKRLLPAATLVLVFTAIGTWLIFPITRFKDIAWDIGMSAVYLINWRLADQSVDYLAEDTLPSPVQHYWSLAVEEQFYVVWPLVLLVVGLVVTRTRTPLAPTATIGLLAIAIPSLVWSVVHTQNSPETAYFVTTTRLWELALGGLVACGATVWPRLSPRLGTTLVLGGLVALLVSFFVITPSTPWPGTAALLPTVATALVLVGGATAAGGLVKVLGSAPMLWIGALSYSLYLWHWPLVTFVKQGVYENDAPLWATTAAVLAAVPLAWAGHRLIENPVRFAPVFKRTRNALSLGGALSVLGALGAVALVTLSPSTPSSNTADPKETDERVGAEAFLPEGMAPEDVKASTTPVVTEAAVPDAPQNITPAVTDATKDYPVTKDQGCVTSVDGTDLKECTFGDQGADKLLIATGDSKIDQWIPAIDDWGQANGYKVVTYFKSACPFNGELLAPNDKRWQGCHDWGQQVNRKVTAQNPDILLTSSLMAGTGDNGEAKVISGYEKVWAPLIEKGTSVVVVDDTPSPGKQPVYECVAEHLDSVNDCTFPAGDGGRGSATLKAAVEAVDGAQFMSLNDWVCPEGTCRPVVGGVLTYRQGSHVSDTYARTLSPMFGARLDAARAAAQ